ncbi:leucine-rich repeat protein [Treponema socranskii]|uniref:leucine-rich repeat protein n=1 Tax=Treponema socranskii TaxID=53419 RepID=UPI003D8DFD09
MRICLRKIGILAAAILFAASVSLALLFTACSNNAGGNTGGGTPAAVSYRIIFSVDGGHGTLKAKAEGVAETATSPISVEKDKTVTFIAKPDAGYKVNKWTITGGTFEAGTGTNGSLTAKVKITANMEVKVSFTELPPGSYTVKHYQEGTDGSYPAEPTENEILSGTPETNAQYTPKTGGAYEGFSYNSSLTKVNGTVQENGTIAADNSTVVELYYERNTVNVTFKLAGGNIGGNTSDVVKSGKYGTALPLPADPEKTGFVFKGWNPALPSPLVFPAADTQYTADWAPLYTVIFGTVGTPANGTLKAELAGTAIASGNPVEYDKTVTFTAKPDAGYKVNKWTITGGTFETETGTNGSLTAKVKVTANTEVKVSFTELPPGSYTVKHYQEGTDGSYPAEPTGTESLSGTSGKPVAYTPKTGGAYTGFTYKPALTKVNGIVQENGTIAADNSTVVELYYERNTVNVTFKLAGGNIGGNTNDVVKSGKYGTVLPLPVNPEKTGFVFKEWNPALPSPLVFPAADTQYTADWAPLYIVTFGTPANGTLKAEIAGTVIHTTNEVEYGKTVTFTAAPEPGYKVDTWTITPASALQEGGTNGSPTAKVKITAATTVNVSFKAEFTVEMTHGANGTLSANPVIPASGKVAEGTKITFTAVPAAGYKVDTWTVTPASALQEGGTPGSTTAKVKITADINVNVTFTSLYEPVAFGANGRGLNNYLKTAAPHTDGIYYIKVTGLTPADLKGDSNFPSKPGVLGKILKDNPTKKVALKLEEIPGLIDMSYCFFGCTSLSQAPAIPSGVTNIKLCFYDCTSLTQAPVIPSSVTNMYSCFCGCTSLRQAPVIPNGVINMANCFERCTSLTQAPAIPSSVTDMNYCFRGCTSLTQAPAIPSSVTNMEECFSGCESLRQAPVIPSSVTNMYGCFKSCTSLTQAPVIPNGVTNMVNCFSGCTSLTQAPAIPSSVTNMRYCFYGCTSLTQAPVIQNGVTYMDDCFKSCTSLTQAPAIPSSVTGMISCFSGCTSLTQAPVIQNGVTYMCNCFYGCTSLTQAPVIPSSVTDMHSCFSGCTNITTVTLKCDYNPAFSVSGVREYAFEKVFSGCEKLTARSIKVPAAQLQTYRNNANKMHAQANWFIADE